LLLPDDLLAPGSRVTVELTVHRAGWIGWLVGSTEHVHATFATPPAPVAQRFLSPAPGTPVELRFNVPAATVSLRLGGSPRRLLALSTARREVPIGLAARGVDEAGTVLVAAAARGWERPPRPVEVSWFAPAHIPEVIVRPATAVTIDPSTPLALTFSRPVRSVLGAHHPRLWPPTPGTWSEPNDHTLVFRPSGLGFEIGAHLRLGLTQPFRVISGAGPDSASTLSWRVAPGSTTRLVQLLAEQGYLPFGWHPAGTPPRATPAAQARAAIAPPRGHLVWRYRALGGLRSIWASASEKAVLIEGALMAFQSAHNMTPTGNAGPPLWRALLRAELGHRLSPYGYSYVYVSESLPETLTLWHDGRVILQTPVNTGIPARPTALGTYPVYLHLTSTTMSGTNPDGSHYADPGVPWVNYFNGGDAVHGFIRPGYGYPQSLGCVEAPISTAAAIFPYVQVGTLVTVAG
jgi:hypothetical protein